MRVAMAMAIVSAILKALVCMKTGSIGEFLGGVELFLYFCIVYFFVKYGDNYDLRDRASEEHKSSGSGIQWKIVAFASKYGKKIVIILSLLLLIDAALLFRHEVW